MNPDSLRLAYDAALKDFQVAVDVASRGGPTTVLPLTSHIYFHVQYLKLIQGGEVSKGALMALQDEVAAIWATT